MVNQAGLLALAQYDAYASNLVLEAAANLSDGQPWPWR